MRASKAAWWQGHSKRPRSAAHTHRAAEVRAAAVEGDDRAVVEPHRERLAAVGVGDRARLADARAASASRRRAPRGRARRALERARRATRRRAPAPRRRRRAEEAAAVERALARRRRSGNGSRRRSAQRLLEVLLGARARRVATGADAARSVAARHHQVVARAHQLVAERRSGSAGARGAGPRPPRACRRRARPTGTPWRTSASARPRCGRSRGRTSS